MASLTAKQLQLNFMTRKYRGFLYLILSDLAALFITILAKDLLTVDVFGLYTTFSGAIGLGYATYCGANVLQEKFKTTTPSTEIIEDIETAPETPEKTEESK